MSEKQTMKALENKIKELEASLRVSNARFLNLFENAAFGVIICRLIKDKKGNAIDFEHLQVNAATQRHTGFDPDMLIGKRALDVAEPEDIANIIQLYGEVVETKKPVEYEQHFAIYDRTLQVGAFSIEGDLFALTFIDITERKRWEKALQESEEKYRMLFHSSSDAVVLVDVATLDIIDANEKMVHLYGYDFDELLQMKATDLSAEPDKTRESLYKQQSDTIPVRHHRKKDGTIFQVEITANYFTLNKRIISIKSIRNISEIKKIEMRLQQVQRMESIGNLAGGIAHDFNNLLFPIMGMAEILIEDLPDGSSEQESAREIFNAGQRGSELVKQILAFSRQSEHKVMPVHIQHVLSQVLKLAHSTIPANIDICENIQRDCGPVRADPTQLHQIAMNLITNAYHAVEHKSGKIVVELKEVILDIDELSGSLLPLGHYVRLTVSDNGTGIEPGMMNDIFEPYFTTKEKGKGTGLGLALVYGIVKKYKGDIQVYSEPGQGTTFNIYLPLVHSPYKKDSARKGGRLQTGCERILLVDDEYAIVNLEKLILERLGYQVTSCTESLEALSIFRANPEAFDLVLSDMTMPNMTGEQLAAELMSVKPDIPVIICTGFSDKINKDKAEEFGIKGFLMKPVLKSELSQIVRKVLDETEKSNHVMF